MPASRLQQIIDDRKSGKGEANKEQQAIKNKLAELRGQFQALVVRSTCARWVLLAWRQMGGDGQRSALARCCQHLADLAALREPCLPPPPPADPCTAAAAAASRTSRARLQSQKQQTRAQLDLASKARDSARSSMKELKGTMKFTKGGWVLAWGGWRAAGGAGCLQKGSRLGAVGPARLADGPAPGARRYVRLRAY